MNPRSPLFLQSLFGHRKMLKAESNTVQKVTNSLDASDVWLVPSNGRVVFDERGNSTWQWPSMDDPFSRHQSLADTDASTLSIVEPSEIHRSQRPWLHESERRSRAVRSAPIAAAVQSWAQDLTVFRKR
jgi:hypothetical protein